MSGSPVPVRTRALAGLVAGLTVAGDLTTADGQTRERVAAHDTASGTLVTSWEPALQSRVRALAVTPTTVHLGASPASPDRWPPGVTTT
ncbi:hypothetical protein O2W14_15380 [Modestobacter sp. VKM Ac-2986]|uniref:hypothetical protein n=1 Tax=Modestobacter sp. VKM Ac-2986 TaxID=3004140 RepID=UPI0022AB6690|nr:hypothetical protein [Modestobacter sp. VKM Ac-2986]MCZ2830218.1 hypothetical protein [Modestobacter sp. VKM Ac-2986]